MYKNIFLFSIILFFLLIPLTANKDSKTIKEYSTGNISLTEKEFNEMKKKFTCITSVKLNDLAKDRILSKNLMIDEKQGEYILPVQVDNSLLPAFPTIRDQGYFKSHTAFAIGYYQLTHTFGLKYGWNNKDDNDNSKKFSPRWAYNLLNNGDDNDTYLDDTYNLLLKHGSIFWDIFPYNCSNYDTIKNWPKKAPIWKRALEYRIKDIGYIEDIDKETGLTLLKHSLVNGEVFVIRTSILAWREKEILDNPESNEDDSEIGKTACYLMNGNRGLHTITVVGYNDDIWIDINENGIMEDAEKGALKLANSLGTSWANNGYIWLAYDAFREHSLVLDEQIYREPAIINGVAFMMLLHDNNKSRMVVELCISHAKRSDLKVTLGIASLHHEEPELLWEPVVLNYNGGNSFDGGTDVSEAVFALDFTDLIEDFFTVYNYPHEWFLFVNDKTSGNPTELKSVKMIDIQGDYYETLFEGDLPVSFDEDTKMFTLLYSPKTGSINYPPIVDAGKNIYLRPDENQAFLEGKAIDEIYNDPPPFDIQWSKLSGPSNVNFLPDSLPETYAEFDTLGIYELQLQADDYEYKTQDTTKVVLFDKTKIWSSDGKDNDQFGFDLDISGVNILEVDAVISSWNNGVYLYKINSIGEWQETQTIKQPYNDRESIFGYSVDIDDNQLIIGEPNGLNGRFRTGKAYIYEKNNNGIWEKTEEFAPEGRSEAQVYGENVAISGNAAVICNPYGPTWVDQAGIVYVYEKDIYGTWIEAAQFREDDSDNLPNLFGLYMDFQNNTILVKSIQEDCIYVFEKTSGIWEKKTKIYNPDIEKNGIFRDSISMNDNTFVIKGKFMEREKIFHCIYIYEKNIDGNWIYKNKIILFPISDDEHKIVIGPISIYQDILSIGIKSYYNKYFPFEFKKIEEYVILVYKKDQNGVWKERQFIKPIDQKLISDRSVYTNLKVYKGYLLYGNTQAYGINAESPGSAYIYRTY